jgi:F0F1-type ATP synthase membrane subunit c/vacuolar-type H+-ATPase subunit K
MALVVAALLVVAGVFLDVFARRRDAFWFHVLGWLSAAAALAWFAFESNEWAWAAMLVVGLALLVIAGPIRRATWAVYGVLGAYAGVVHYLSDGLNEDRWPFALLLLALGLAIFVTGMMQHRYGKAWAQRFGRRPPPELSP